MQQCCKNKVAHYGVWQRLHVNFYLLSRPINWLLKQLYDVIQRETKCAKCGMVSLRQRTKKRTTLHVLLSFLWDTISLWCIQYVDFTKYFQLRWEFTECGVYEFFASRFFLKTFHENNFFSTYVYVELYFKIDFTKWFTSDTKISWPPYSATVWRNRKLCIIRKNFVKSIYKNHVL